MPRVNPRPPGQGRPWAVIAVFVFIVGCQLALAVLSIEMMSSVRAYVTGESLYSKGQKDAQIHLLDYAERHEERDYQLFLEALAVPLGLRVAREALQLPEPDLALAREGHIKGGTHPDDIEGAIRLFLWFDRVPFMADAISIWTEGDKVIEQMRTLVERAHERVAAGDLNAPAIREMRELAPVLNKRMTRLESDFSAQLGVASRETQRVLLALNLGIGALLALSGVAFVRHSARVQAATEDEVRRRQQSLQRLLDSTAEGLYGVDPQGRCTFINRAALAMLGYEREQQVLGRDIDGLVRAEPADVPATPQRAQVHAVEAVFRRRDGSTFPVEYWSHPVLEDGRLHGAVATFFDVTERQHMRAALREGELRMARLVDAVNDAVITVDTDDHIVLFNRAAEQLFGVSAADAIGQPVASFIPHHALLSAPVAGDGDGAGVLHELTGTRSGGKSFPMEASLSRLDTDTGTLTTVVLRDVSARHQARAERRAREALEASSRAKTEFLSRMSHELRTPLNAVLGFAQLMRIDTEQPLPPLQHERALHIQSAGEHLLALVNDVLDLSRVESGQLRVSLEPVEVVGVLADALALVSTLAQEHGVELLKPDGDAEAWVLADRLRLRQVLVNLLSNAVKYNRRGGSVRIGWSRHEDSWRLVVADTGQGITPQKLARLYEPFNRLGAENSKIEGTGIGLVLSLRLVESMQGELRIDSAPGRGTLATVELRAAERATAVARPRTPPSQHGALDGALSVLYAEDNEVNAELVRQVARLRPSVRLRVADSGARALAMARDEPPDLVLVDMNLGDMSGLELARRLRQAPWLGPVRLVALSADALPEQIDAALADGFEGYLTKPIDFRALLNVLDGLA